MTRRVTSSSRQQARSSIREINTAINVIDKRPVLKEAFELGLLAVDVITLGEFAGARVLTTSVVKQLVLSRTGKELSDDAAARVANNIYADSPGFAQAAQREFKPGTRKVWSPDTTSAPRSSSNSRYGV